MPLFFSFWAWTKSLLNLSLRNFHRFCSAVMHSALTKWNISRCFQNNLSSRRRRATRTFADHSRKHDLAHFLPQGIFYLSILVVLWPDTRTSGWPHKKSISLCLLPSPIWLRRPLRLGDRRSGSLRQRRLIGCCRSSNFRRVCLILYAHVLSALRTRGTTLQLLLNCLITSMIFTRMSRWCSSLTSLIDLTSDNAK